MAVPTFLSVLLYLTACQTESWAGKKKHVLHSGVFPNWNATADNWIWYGIRIMRKLYFQALSSTWFLPHANYFPVQHWRLKHPDEMTVPHHTVALYYRRYYITTFCHVPCTLLFYCSYVWHQRKHIYEALHLSSILRCFYFTWVSPFSATLKAITERVYSGKLWC